MPTHTTRILNVWYIPVSGRFLSSSDSELIIWNEEVNAHTSRVDIATMSSRNALSMTVTVIGWSLNSIGTNI